jgi:uncharacterized membrane protein
VKIPRWLSFTLLWVFVGLLIAEVAVMGLDAYLDFKLHYTISMFCWAHPAIGLALCCAIVAFHMIAVISICVHLLCPEEDEHENV